MSSKTILWLTLSLAMFLGAGTAQAAPARFYNGRGGLFRTFAALRMKAAIGKMHLPEATKAELRREIGARAKSPYRAWKRSWLGAAKPERSLERADDDRISVTAPSRTQPGKVVLVTPSGTRTFQGR